MKDLSTVMIIEFTKDYGHWSENCLAVFDINKVSEEEVHKFIYNSVFESYHPDIIVVTPEQWNSVFGG